MDRPSHSAWFRACVVATQVSMELGMGEAQPKDSKSRKTLKSIRSYQKLGVTFKTNASKDVMLSQCTFLERTAIGDVNWHHNVHNISNIIGAHVVTKHPNLVLQVLNLS